MRKLSVFNQITVDGHFTDAKNDMSWAHQGEEDKEWQKFVAGNAGSGGELVFGRITYQMMAGYWPSAVAAQQNPKVAEAMNALPKVVFSRTLIEASWNNTRLFKGNLVGRMKKLKSEKGKDLVVMGSGNLVSQLARARLVDAFRFVVNPLALGAGRTNFEGMKKRLPLKLVDSRTFKNGNVVLNYVPA